MRTYELVIPEGEERRPGDEVRWCTPSEVAEIREFIDYSVTNRYRLDVEVFYSHYKQMDYTLARAAIMYAIRVRWPIGLVQLGEIMNREHSTLVRTQQKAMEYFGDKMTEVSKLLKRWDLLKCRKNTI